MGLFHKESLMQKMLCAHCGKKFLPRPQTPHQSYCSESQCQKMRRKRWVDEKRKSDLIFRDNQARAQKAWMERNPDYWRNYRKDNPDYAERNRARQRATLPLPQELNGIYCIRSIRSESLAKSNVWIVEIRPTCNKCKCKKNACKEIT
jgi:endogenous inhibitor of DNA gyrase (YacG/DUF329 family)